MEDEDVPRAEGAEILLGPDGDEVVEPDGDEVMIGPQEEEPAASAAEAQAEVPVDAPAQQQQPAVQPWLQLRQTFDTSLTARHNYLGEVLSLDETYTTLKENSIVSLPLIRRKGVIPILDQMLPLMVMDSIEVVHSLVSCIENRQSSCIGILPDMGEAFKGVGMIGVTAEIAEYADIDMSTAIDPFIDFVNNRPLFGITVKAKCHQRFRVLEINGGDSNYGAMSGKVKILPEGDQPLNLPDCKALSMRRCKNPIDKRFAGAVATSIPAFVYRQYDADLLTRRLKIILQYMNPIPVGDPEQRRDLAKYDEQGMPNDPRAFSYWVARNIPFSDSERNHVLKFNSVVQRLRWELGMMQKYTTVMCKECQEVIGNLKDAFSMSADGPQGSYVNPHGYIHETLTMFKVKSTFTRVGQPDPTFSWFPGYSWTIIECGMCQSHLGWEFESATLIPSKFWGFSRRFIRIGGVHDVQAVSAEEV